MSELNIFLKMCLKRREIHSEHNRRRRLTGGLSRGVERQHSLQGHKRERDAEGLEHQLHHPLPVLHRVHGGFGQQHRMILGTHRQLLERVMPDLQQRQEQQTRKRQVSKSMAGLE